ncbi:unnamed protein product [Ranitomeya imitator]|uniref:Septin-7 n=1 Tax=Ranitomeya imitator TaxID=111125 RepID=A0ABN9LCT5_9NEOB|nr:unnamed protein product [Ranitomeya imitator]
MISRQQGPQSPRKPLVTLRCKGLKSCSAREVLLLKKARVLARLKFANEHLDDSEVIDWEKVLWSDEMKIELFGINSTRHVWMKRNAAYDPKSTIPTVKHGGESGLGKSTLINSLFLTDLYAPDYPGPSHRIKKTVQVEQSKVLIKEGGVQLLLTIVDTPGFGDAVDNSNCWQPVIDYIDSKFEDYLNAESRVNRRQMPDNRVQCCLYFIAPSGHGLKPLDIEFMKRLHEKVNIIPLIAKADTLTPEECQQFKKQIMKEIQEHKIKIYEFPETDDEEENKLVKKIKDRLPLAVVGSNTIIEVNGKRVRGRQYPWGVAEVENSEHCDFTILRNMLIRTHMQDLKDVTNNVHYENYRSRKLAAVTYNGVDNNKNKGQLTK